MYPYLLDIQSDTLSALATRIVAPLGRKSLSGRKKAAPPCANSDLRQRIIVDSYPTSRLIACQRFQNSHRDSRAHARWNSRRTRLRNSRVLVLDIGI
ncbi:CcdB family protein [Halomonas sp. DP1Y21-3]|uniref:CcdB family protein n=1 Tax=Halomonas sp. DP1Y21-3 TaxID=2859080 RepID=UPI0021BD0A74|nr:CcdB family protein [Halomonas sp. DP1Y21-3]